MPNPAAASSRKHDAGAERLDRSGGNAVSLCAMRNVAPIALVFLGGFAIMVLEIIGARYLAKDFGGSFYVWTSQIGVILIALALGYAVGGWLADRFEKASFLAWLLVPTGVLVFLIPIYADRLVEVIVMRHSADEDIPMLWQKLDPAIGSALIFLLPCFVLATLSPYMIRLSARRLSHVGRISGLIYAASTVGSIAGVFISGYILIDQMKISTIFRCTGIFVAALGGMTLFMDRWMVDRGPEGVSQSFDVGPERGPLEP